MREYASGSSRPVRIFTYLDGQVTRLDEDPDEEGRFKHIVYYRQSVPVKGRKDLDGDGRYEIQEVYSEGSLRTIELDQDGDGKPEYMQSFSPRSEMYWDYDGDGIFDSREFEDAHGNIVREFSSSLNGIFDLSRVIKRIRGSLKETSQ